MTQTNKILFSSLMGNSQKLDGGAMYGNAPKALWSRWSQADESNRIDLACRALLIETEGHKVLLETGIGCYMNPKLRERYGVVETEHVLLSSLSALGLTPDDIDMIVLSHLHFDHAGGLLSPWSEQQAPELLFKNAHIYVGREAYQRACNPHPRDRASFIPELMALLKDNHRLHLFEADEVIYLDGLQIQFVRSDGHTPAMMCADLRWQNGRMVFAADLIPGRNWVHVPITMGYDRFPEHLIDEKRALLTQLSGDKGFLFYTHDPSVAVSKVMHLPEKDRFVVCQEVDHLVRQSL